MDKDPLHGGPFSQVSKWVARRVGNPLAFLVALAVVLLWAVSGPFFGFSDTWQLVINTATTIATFLMVFLIQNQQTRDFEAMQVKLDELIESIPGARRDLLDLEEMPEEELHRLQQEYEGLAAKARRRRRGRPGHGQRRRPTPMAKDAR